MLPVDGDRRATFTGCGTVAQAQIMNFHRHPLRGNGQSEPYTMTGGMQPSVNFEVYYDWNNMLNTYRIDGSDSNEEQRNAVALLMFHIGVANGRDFFIGGRGTESSFQSREETLINFFGYDRSIQMLERRFFDDNEWEAIIREQLDRGLPVYYWGIDSEADHAFVVDGYDNTGKFHINWGGRNWGVGYYSLNELIPPGYSYRKFYNNQYIIINIMPDKGGVSADHELTLMNFSVDKNSISQNEAFVVTIRIRNISNFSKFPGGQAGVALVDNNNKIVAIVGTSNNFEQNPLSSRNLTINSFVPETVEPGQYRLMSVIRPTDGDWEIIMRSAIGDGVPNAINFTVTPEKSTTPGGGYGMGLVNFATEKTNASQNERFTVSYTLRNMGQEIFPGGQAGVALVDNAGNIVEVIGMGNTSLRNPGGTTSLIERNCTVPATVPPGQYQLRIVIRPTDGEWRLATLALPDVPSSIPFTVE
jgi:hypothetical protein